MHSLNFWSRIIPCLHNFLKLAWLKQLPVVSQRVHFDRTVTSQCLSLNINHHGGNMHPSLKHAFTIDWYWLPGPDCWTTTGTPLSMEQANMTPQWSIAACGLGSLHQRSCIWDTGPNPGAEQLGWRAHLKSCCSFHIPWLRTLCIVMIRYVGSKPDGKHWKTWP